MASVTIRIKNLIAQAEEFFRVRVYTLHTRAVGRSILAGLSGMHFLRRAVTHLGLIFLLRELASATRRSELTGSVRLAPVPRFARNNSDIQDVER